MVDSGTELKWDGIPLASSARDWRRRVIAPGSSSGSVSVSAGLGSDRTRPVEQNGRTERH